LEKIKKPNLGLFGKLIRQNRNFCFKDYRNKQQPFKRTPFILHDPKKREEAAIKAPIFKSIKKVSFKDFTV